MIAYGPRFHDNDSMRIPDRDYKPSKKLVLAIGAGLIGIVFGVSYCNFQSHESTRRQTLEVSQTRSLSMTVPSASIASSAASTRSVLETIKHQNDIDLVMTRGWGLIDQRNPKSADLAAEIFREALRDIDPANAQFYNGLGRASLLAGRPADALASFRNGISIDPTIVDMYSGMGWAYWQLHQPYNAKQEWEAALKLDPKSVDSWSAMAWIYLALGENAKAKQGFAILVARNTKDANAVMGLSMSRSAVQVDVNSVRKYFPLPDLRYLTTPPDTIPSSGPSPSNGGN
jgi:predicted Zn-dependent protease